MTPFVRTVDPSWCSKILLVMGFDSIISQALVLRQVVQRGTIRRNDLSYSSRSHKAKIFRYSLYLNF